MKEEIRVPLSRFKREMPKYMRKIEKNPNLVVIITHNKKDKAVVLHPAFYNNLLNN